MINIVEAARSLHPHTSLSVPAEASSSRMFAGLSDELMKALSREPLTGNFHHYGLTIEVIQLTQLTIVITLFFFINIQGIFE